MKAYRLHKYADPAGSSLVDASIPEIAADEVLIRVKAAAVNPLDWQIQAGWLKEYLPHRLPLTLGWDVAVRLAELPRSDIRAVLVGVKPDAARLTESAALIDSGKLWPVVAGKFDLSEAGRALAVIREGHVHGKLVITL